jgi:hypothetical protein
LLVFAPSGDVVFEKNENVSEASYSVDLTDEEAGTYQVVLKRGNETVTTKLLKQ